MERTRLGLAKTAAKEELRRIPGVEGIGIGDGTLRVYVHTADVASQVPSEIHGMPVECIVTGSVIPLAR